MKNPTPSFSITTFLTVFALPYWYFLCFTVIFGITALSFFTKIYENQMFKGYSRLTDKIGSAILFISLSALNLDISIVKNSFCNSKNSISAKTFILTFCIFGYLNLAVYQAGLTSSLTLKLVITPIQSLEDLLSKPSYTLMVTQGSSDESYFSEATKLTDPIAWSVWDTLLKNNPDSFVKNGRSAQEQLLADGRKVFFAAKHDVEIVLSYYPCLINTKSQKYSQSQGGFPFRKESPYQKLFKAKIINIVEHGEWKYAREEAKRRKENLGCNTEDDAFDPMGYLNFFSLFIAAGSGTTISLFILLGELYSRRAC